MRILIVEDSVHLRRSLRIGLSGLGFQVEECGDGAQAISLLALNRYDLIILDLMLPSVDGMTILHEIRQHNGATKVLILSARDQVQDKTQALFQGADDYMVKPFSFEELHARITALMRRSDTLEQARNELCIDDCVLNLDDKTFRVKDQPCKLTPTEFKILSFLFKQQDKLVSTEQLSEYLVGYFEAVSKNAIEAHLSAIKKKVRKLGSELPVHNRRGFGYTASIKP